MAHLPRARPAADTTQPPRTTVPPAAAHVQGDATSWWLSTEKMTVCVDLDAAGIIVAAPPVARKFIGQSARNLDNWLRRQPGFHCQKL